MRRACRAPAWAPACAHVSLLLAACLAVRLSDYLSQFRADRGVAPLYSDIVAARDSTMKEALRRRQVCVCLEGVVGGG